MGSVTHPRGRLPQRVYWIRRSVVIGIALLLVFGIGKLLGGTGSDPTSSIKASTSSAQEPQPSLSIGPVAPSRVPHQRANTVLLPPSGECKDDEVGVQPYVRHAWGLKPVLIRLALQGLQPACSFKVSPKTLAVKITSGNDRIWSSQDCPSAIPTSEVVVRSAVPTYVNVTWSGRRSDTGCPRNTSWALGGFYHVFAAALGSTPTDVQFEVTRAPTQVVTKTAKPKPSHAHTHTSSPKASPEASPTVTPKPKHAEASPSVSGKGSKCGGDNAAGSC